MFFQSIQSKIDLENKFTYFLNIDMIFQDDTLRKRALAFKRNRLQLLRAHLCTNL